MSKHIPAREPNPSDDRPGGDLSDLSDISDLSDLDFDIPDDLSSLIGDPELAVVITQVADAQALAAVCAVAGVDADVVPTSAGALAVLKDRAGRAPSDAAGAITKLVRGVPAILVERRAGQLTMTRWQNGEAGDELPPGLVLGGASEEVEDLFFGAKDADTFPGVIASASLGRFKAMRILAAQTRKARRS